MAPARNRGVSLGAVTGQPAIEQARTVGTVRGRFDMATIVQVGERFERPPLNVSGVLAINAASSAEWAQIVESADRMNQDRAGFVRLVPAAAAKFWKNVDVILLAVLTTLAVAPFGRLYADHHYLVLAAGAALVAAVVSLIVSPRLPLPAAIVAAVLAAYLYLAVTVFHTFGPAGGLGWRHPKLVRAF